MSKIRKYISHIDLVISMWLALVSIDIYVEHEDSMINHIGSKGNYNTKEKWVKWSQVTMPKTMTTHDRQFMIAKALSHYAKNSN